MVKNKINLPDASSTQQTEV